MVPRVPELSSHERRCLLDFWSVYAPAQPEISADVLAAAEQMPEFRDVVRNLDPAVRARSDAESLERMRRAIVDGDWEPLVTHLDREARLYAAAGIPLSAWYELTRRFRRVVLEHVARALGHDPAGQTRATEGLSLYQDIALEGIATTYLDAR